MMQAGERALSRGKGRRSKARLEQHGPGSSRGEPPRVHPLALACLLAFGAASTPAWGANCDANDAGTLAACISGAGSGDTVTFTGSIVITGDTPALPAGVSIVPNGYTLSGSGRLLLGSGAYLADSDASLASLRVLISPGETGVLAAAAGATLNVTSNVTSQTTTLGTLQVGDAGRDGTVVFNNRVSEWLNLHVAAGTADLHAAGVYGGNTQVDAGATLRISGPAEFNMLGARGTSVLNNGQIIYEATTSLITPGQAASFSSIISGSGGLTVRGTVPLVISQANTYSGQTQIEAGARLVLSESGSLGTGDVLNDGILQSVRTTAGTLTNNISGSGSLKQDGEVLTLTGNNTYTGITTVASGKTLRIGDGGTTGTLGSGSVTNDGTLVFNRADTIAVANNIAGGGGVTQAGSGTTILTGNNTYAGTTSISAGTVRVGNGGTTGTLGTGNVANDSALVFDRADTYVVANNISGSGTVTQAGSGTTVFTGGNTYSGTTTISSGTLQIGNGGTTGTLGSGGVTNSAALVFNRSDTHTVANNISGTGTLTQAGSGTLVLTGTNTYTGNTTINAGGTLQIGAGGTLGSGNVVNNGGLIVNRADTLALANDISGTGSLTKGGSGTLILSGHNSYTGTTGVTGGVMQVMTGDALGGSNVQVLGGTLRGGADLTLGNGLYFPAFGTLSAAAGTTMTLSGRVDTDDNLTVTFGSATDTGTVVMASNSMHSGFLSSVVVAGGTLVAANDSLNGMTSVAGNTTVNAGATLRYDVDGRINNLRGAGTVRASGNLTVGAGNFSGVITGAGHLIKSNTGGLILSGDNTYTGGTAVTAGVLQVGNGGASGSLGSGAISVTGTGVLDFSRAGTLIVADAISGNGTLRHNGTGTTVITDAGTFSGTTNVNRGILAVNGALGGATNVNSGGTLGGNGTLGNVNVMSGGVLAPGNSIGTLTVNGNLTFSAGSIYRVETDAAGNADRINVNGNLSINGGTVDVRAGSGNYARNTRYTILTNTGAQSGTFAGVSSNLAFLTPTLFYDANNVYLNLLSANAPSYTSVAQTPNQRSVANYLNSFANNPGNAQAEALIRQIDNLSADQARNAFDALSGSQHASASQVALAGTRGFHEVLGRRLVSMDTGGFGGAAALRNQAFGLQSPATPWNSADAPVQLAGLFGGAPAAGATSTLNGAVMGMRGGGAGPGTARGSTDHGGAGHGDAGRDTGMAASGDGDAGTPGSGNNTNGLWGQALGAGGRIASDGNGAGSAYRAGGFMAGYERALSEAWTAGAAAGYVRSSWEASTSGIAPASGKVATPQAALYARHARGAWRLSVTGSYAEHRFDTSRTVTVGTASSSATSSHRGREWGFSTQAEVALDAGAWQLRPLAGLRHTQLREDAFSESGNAGTALAVDRRVTRSTTFSAGARLLRPFGGKDSGNAQGGWELRAVYAHLFGDNDAPLSARLAGQAASFTVNGTPLRRDALQLGAGVSAQIGRGLAAFADLSYEARGSGQDAYAIGAGLRYLW